MLNKKQKISLLIFRDGNKKNYGGPGTFINNFTNWLEKLNIQYSFLHNFEHKNILVISSTKKIFSLFYLKLKGKKIIQRLDGYLWDHKYSPRYKIKIKYFLINVIMNFIRKYLANVVIYQSNYLKKSWSQKYGVIKNSRVIYNATDRSFFLSKKKKANSYKIVCVEGTVQNNFYTKNIIKALSIFVKKNKKISSLDIYGNYSKNFKNFFYQNYKLNFFGALPKNKISKIYLRHKVIFFTLEQYPACPNSVIEALASGTLVTGFDNGSLKEMIEDKNFLINFENLEKFNNFYYILNVIEKKLNYLINNNETLIHRLPKIAKKFRPDLMGNSYIKEFTS